MHTYVHPSIHTYIVIGIFVLCLKDPLRNLHSVAGAECTAQVVQISNDPTFPPKLTGEAPFYLTVVDVCWGWWATMNIHELTFHEHEPSGETGSLFAGILWNMHLFAKPFLIGWASGILMDFPCFTWRSVAANHCSLNYFQQGNHRPNPCRLKSPKETSILVVWRVVSPRYLASNDFFFGKSDSDKVTILEDWYPRDWSTCVSSWCTSWCIPEMDSILFSKAWLPPYQHKRRRDITLGNPRRSLGSQWVRPAIQS